MKTRVLGTSELPLGRAEPFGDLRVNSVKHLLCVFPDSFAEQSKSKRRFVARLLRMTLESSLRPSRGLVSLSHVRV